MCITGSMLEANFQVDPEKGHIWHHPEKDRRGQKRKRAGYIKSGSRSDGGGYRIITVRGRMVRAHHLIWCWVHGEWSSSEIDHINGDRDDNRIKNLRLATVSQNRNNRPILRSNTSGYKWVSWSKQRKKWLAEVWYQPGKKHVSFHTTAKEAYEKACSVALRFHGAFFNPGKKT
jgi:hypothetical protein